MRKTKSSILEAVYETAKGLHKAGVMDRATLREYDHLCRPPVEHQEPVPMAAAFGILVAKKSATLKEIDAAISGKRRRRARR